MALATTIGQNLARSAIPPLMIAGIHAAKVRKKKYFISVTPFDSASISGFKRLTPIAIGAPTRKKDKVTGKIHSSDLLDKIWGKYMHKYKTTMNDFFEQDKLNKILVSMGMEPNKISAEVFDKM